MFEQPGPSLSHQAAPVQLPAQRFPSAPKAAEKLACSGDEESETSSSFSAGGASQVGPVAVHRLPRRAVPAAPLLRQGTPQEKLRRPQPMQAAESAAVQSGAAESVHGHCDCLVLGPEE
jgi:hypothetical protein